ncbi:MAG: hypothetical protein DCC75_10435 [Proteobacteria bacterium]|nr:MAG: hypothetical protein DCC75_10435 [Pseudomonadota bacterium]
MRILLGQLFKVFLRPKSLALSAFFPAAAICILSACVRSTDTPKLTEQMTGIQNSLNRLYAYAWDPKAFSDSENDKTIGDLLAHFEDQFHTVQHISKTQITEPGFSASLESQLRMISDIRGRFQKNEKEYARKRLTHITANCIACHSRYGGPENIFGHFPPSIPSSLEASRAEAEYLFATRQYTKASEALYGCAKRSAGGSFYDGLNALKLWLVIKVRVEDDPVRAAAGLTQLQEEAYFSARDQALIEDWKRGLQKIIEVKSAQARTLDRAKQLLGRHIESRNEMEDEKALPQTLYASQLLHKRLSISIPPNESREASYLLALSYLHMPIEQFDTLREEYAAQVARQFPGSIEAQKISKL